MAIIDTSAIAVIDGEDGTTFTYKQIDDMSTLLAQKLYHDFGIRPGKVTGILMNRNWQFIVAYLASIKAGGAYMPLEVVYPKDLLRRVLDNSTGRASENEERSGNNIALRFTPRRAFLAAQRRVSCYASSLRLLMCSSYYCFSCIPRFRSSLVRSACSSHRDLIV